MDKAKLEKFKQVLLEHKERIQNSGILRRNDDLHISSDDLADEADIANSIVNQQVTFNMRTRELNKLRAIEFALARIEDGTYGHCDECDEEISVKRLMNQPWATLCIEHAEELERANSQLHQVG